jgi:trans-aconitate 2-methyltransferase
MAEKTADWDAATYDRLADPQETWGREVLARLELDGDETVLDAGCGSGRVTSLLLDLLPRGRVIGVDASPSMIELARRTLDERAQLRVCDLTELELQEPVDAIFSNATFHWILDHELLFRRLFAVLRPGGVIEAQCGGEGNVAEWQRAADEASRDSRFAPHLDAMPPATNFASVADTSRRLREAGFEVGEVWLEPKVVRPPEPRAYVRSVGLGKQLALLPASLREPFVDAVLELLPDPLVLRYVRLNITARRSR